MSPRFSAVFGRTSRSTPPSGAPSSPPATRIQRRWWADTRVILGVVLVIACTLIGARVATMSSDEVVVWQVQRDVSAGAVLAPGDLEPVGVDPQLAGLYAPVSEMPAQPLARDLRAGELVGLTALEAGETRDMRWVTLPVEPLHAPADLAPGDRVDVWATADPARSFDTAGAIEPQLVLPDALVVGIDVDARGFAGDYGVVVEIVPEEARGLLAAVRGGMIDLVRVPHGSRTEPPSTGSSPDQQGPATAAGDR